MLIKPLSSLTLKLILLMGLSIALVYVFTQLNFQDEIQRQDSTSKNDIIFSDDYSLSLSDDEQQWLAENPVIRLGIDRAFPPFGSINENGEYVGFTADFMRIIEHRLKVTFQIKKHLSWARTMEMAKAGKLDIVAGLVNTKQRQAFLNFTEPYVNNPTIIISDGLKQGYIGSLKNLAGKKVAIERGSYAAGELGRSYPEITLLETQNTSMALSQVTGGIADAYVGNAVTASYLIKALGLQNLSFSGETEYSSNHSIGIHKSKPMLLSIVSKALDSISEKERSIIKNYWFGMSIPKQWDRRIVMYILAGFFGLLLLALVWIFSLRKAGVKLKKSQQAIKHQAEIDPLTKLGNRRKFYRQLEEEITNADKENTNFALLFLDLDLFKDVNDTHGHYVGDTLLKKAAARIEACVDSESIFRLGGDEFTLLINHSDKTAIESAVSCIKQSLNREYRIKSNLINVTCSIGITQYPADAENAQQLVINGDQAMYHAKKSGRNCHAYFTPSMKQEVQHKIKTIRDLKIAIQTRQFSLFYQPIIDLKTNKICKGESLLRWQHPIRGLVSPSEFIPIAEETGLINQIGEWILHKAVSDAVKITQEIDQDFQISINASPLQFRKHGMNITKWYQHIEKNKLSGKNLVIEITESLLMESNPTVHNNLFQLRDNQIQVAIDDFGTGYSSLAYFKKFDIDLLKIDQSFVRNIKQDYDDMVLVKTIINMAHQLGCKVIAEGIETDEQMELLKQAGCDFGQGYLISKPLAINDFVDLVRSSHYNQLAVDASIA